ncbi:MAG: hypothetical protein AB7N95_05970 [Nitrospiraceae bacterium]
MLLTVASILTFSGLAIFAYLLWERIPVRTGSLTLGDITNLATLVVAIVSLYVGIAAYQQAVRDSKEQQENLDASRKQLQAVVDAATKQQEILGYNLETSKAQQELLSKNLEISKSQLGLLEEQWRREQERQSRRPIAEIALLTTAGPKLIDDLEKLPEIEFPLEKDKQWARAIFLVSNKGKVEIIRPIVRIYAIPNVVHVDEADTRISERADHNAFQFSGLGVNDIDPVQMAGGPYKFAVDVTIPDATNAFDLTFAIQGKNLPRKSYTLHLKVVRPHS